MKKKKLPTRKERYAIIKNAFGDSKLANELRSAGALKIYALTGIDITKSAKKDKELKPQTKKEISRKKQYYSRIESLINKGYTPKEAYKARTKKVEKAREREYIYTRNDWIESSRNHTLPDYINELSRNENARRGKMFSHPYGYSVAYSRIIRGMTLSQARQSLAPTKLRFYYTSEMRVI